MKGKTPVGKIFYLIGRSAVGKDTLYRMLLDRIPALCRVVPYTTRPMRPGETEGVAYHFISRETFAQLKHSGKVIESRTYETVEGPWTYATVDDGTVDVSRNSYLTIGTLESYLSVRRYYPAGVTVPVYIEADGGQCLIRSVRRESLAAKPDYAEVCRRYLADEIDFSPEKLAEAGIGRHFRNDDLESCAEEIAAYIREQDS